MLPRFVSFINIIEQTLGLSLIFSLCLVPKLLILDQGPNLIHRSSRNTRFLLFLLDCTDIFDQLLKFFVRFVLFLTDKVLNWFLEEHIRENRCFR